jgi:hypothetical protein
MNTCTIIISNNRSEQKSNTNIKEYIKMKENTTREEKQNEMKKLIEDMTPEQLDKLICLASSFVAQSQSEHPDLHRQVG